MLVSIIIPLYNREKLITETLDSILAQTYPTWEVIVVDDGSTDNSVEVVEGYVQKDVRIKLFNRYRLPKGAPTCRNIGAEKSQGKYLIFLDSDDLLADFCLENRVQVMEKTPELDFAVFYTLLFEEKPNDCTILWNIKTDEDTICRFLRLEVPWAPHSVIWKKESVKNIPQDELLLSFQDWDLHIRALSLGFNYVYFDKCDSYWRIPQNRETIGKGSLSDKHLQSHHYLFKKTFCLIKLTKHFDNQNIKTALSALLFWLVQQFLSKNQKSKALSLWPKINNSANLYSSISILIYILWYGKRGFWRYNIFFRKKMDSIYFDYFKYTFRNTNYENPTH